MSFDPGHIARFWNRGRSVREVGEFGLISRLRGQLAAGATHSAYLRLALGDDAAILRPPAGWDLLLTCDIMIEGRHFRRDWLTPAEAGIRAAVVNLSDIAAMGGLPIAALVSLGIPPAMTLESIEALYTGLAEALAAEGASIAGGNVSAAADLIIDLTLIGRVEEDAALRRSGARDGDLVFLTGFPGRSAAALTLLGDADLSWPRLAADCQLPEVTLRERVRGWLASPRARIAAGRHLVENRIASAAIDQSDGVAGDLRHICEESGVGIEIEATHLPIEPLLAKLADASGGDLFEWLLGPSDDYELLFTTAAEKADLVFAMSTALEIPITPIGRVTRGSEVALRGTGSQRITLGDGWDHLGEV